MRTLRRIVLSVAVVLAAYSPLIAQTPAPTATTTTTAPVFASQNDKQEPLRVAREGSVLVLLEQLGDWCRVEFQDPEFGRRVGYVQRKLVRIDQPISPAPQRRPLPQPPATVTAPERQTSSSSRARDLVTSPTAPVTSFNDASLLIEQGDKHKNIDVKLHYESDALVIEPTYKKEAAAGRTFKYADVASAEYSFGKSPRVSAALLVSPLFLFNSSKSHWLTVKTGDDYVLMRLDKSNYKLVIAELEKRTRITVASVGENK